MKIDIDFNKDEQSAYLTFYNCEFKEKRDFIVAISTIEIFSGDFSLDPELEIEDLEDILKQSKQKNSDKFIVIINEDEIEVDLGNS